MLMKEMNKNIKNIILLQALYLYYSLVGILSKRIASYDYLSAKFIFGYLTLLVAIFFYALLWQQIIKRTSLFVAYANKGMVILWTLIWAMIFFNEKVNFKNIIGSFIIIAGITLVARDE